MATDYFSAWKRRVSEKDISPKYSYGKRQVCPVCGRRFAIQMGCCKYWKYFYHKGRKKFYCCSYSCQAKKLKGES